MDTYGVVKTLHVACAAISYAGFAARGAGMALDAKWVARRWVKVAPHVVDTLLLASAIALAVMSAQYPPAQGWLTAKVLALIAYIAVGMVALRRSNPARLRVGAWVAAQLIFFYIVAVAVTRSAAPWSG